MQTLTAYFAGGFKSEEYYNLHHETDLACNEVYNFVCKVFDDRETFYDNSVGLAGTFTRRAHTRRSRAANFTSSISPAAVSGARRSMPSGFSSPRPAIRSSRSGEQDGQLHISSCQGINVDKLDKGCLVFNTEREEGFAVCVVDNTNRAEAR